MVNGWFICSEQHAFVHMPVKTGDLLLLVFSLKERYLETRRNSGMGKHWFHFRRTTRIFSCKLRYAIVDLSRLNIFESGLSFYEVGLGLSIACKKAEF